MTRALSEDISESEVYQNKLLGEIIEEYIVFCKKEDIKTGYHQNLETTIISDWWIKKMPDFHSKMSDEMFRQQNTKNEDYYCKARTDKGWLFFRTKEDFEKWRSEDEDKVGGTNTGGMV